MWKINRTGLFADIAAAFDRFVDDFLDWLVTTPPVAAPALENQIKASGTPLCRVMAECDKLRNFAIRLAHHPQRAQIAAAYRSLTAQYAQIVDGHVQLPSLPDPVAAECFAYFYDNLVDTAIFRKQYIAAPVERTKQAYRSDFGSLIKSCPYCDLKDIPFHGDSSIDHFLTKSRVPLLAIFSQNLVVACTSCNDRLKNKTMLFPIVHPFYHQAADQLKLQFHLVFPPHEIRLVNQAQTPLEQARMDNYIELFELNRQYQERVYKLHTERQEIRREVGDRYKEAGLGKPVQRHRVEGMLDRVLAARGQTKRKMKGHHEFTKLFVDYYEHLQLPAQRKKLLNYIISEIELSS